MRVLSITIHVDNSRDETDNNVMNVSLPVPLEDFVRRKVAAGDFQSADELVCEGLRLLQQQEAWKTEARHKIDLGWEQAKSGQLKLLAALVAGGPTCSPLSRRRSTA